MMTLHDPLCLLNRVLCSHFCSDAVFFHQSTRCIHTTVVSLNSSVAQYAGETTSVCMCDDNGVTWLRDLAVKALADRVVTIIIIVS